jgi:DNA-binding NarL/FixJ family response regulator
MSKLTRILLAEDHHLVRAGIRSLLEGFHHVVVVAEASDGRSALEIAQDQLPDLILMDIAMPVMNGLEVTAAITQQHPAIKIIILSMHASEEYVLQALQAGATGYLMKDTDMLELQRAIETVMANKTYLSPAVSQHVADYIRRTNYHLPHSENENMADLTDRQVEILKLIAEGYSTRNIAETLNISIKTAEAHRTNIMKRLDIYTIAGLVRYAIRVGVIQS